MNKIKAMLSVAVMCASFSAVAEDSAVSLIVNAKFTGMCGTLKQMSSFQTATKMLGGDDFLVRFIGVESARLGMSVDGLLKQCIESTELYNSTVDMLSEAK